MIHIYNILSLLLLPVYLFLLVYRLIKSKEIFSRIHERFGIASKARPIGNLIWIHAVSVGESSVALTLIEGINKVIPNISFLITSSTKSSSNILKEKLPKNAIHQFLPIDNIIFVRKFLKTWKPNLSIFIESEFWPCLLSETSKTCILLVFNARLSDRSFKRLQKTKSLVQLIDKCVTEIIAQSDDDLKKFITLGLNRVTNLGNIKFANNKLTVDGAELSMLSTHLKDRKIIVLASSHMEDEEVVVNIIKALKIRHPSCYFVIILRHPERKDELSKICKQNALSFSVRSEINLPNLDSELYIVDRFGELGLFFSLSYISIIGGSFGKAGHNPIEPAQFGNLIMFGPNMSNCRNLAKEMVERKCAIQVNSGQDLLRTIDYFLTDSSVSEVAEYKMNSLKFVEQHEQIISNYLSIVSKYCASFI